jgi:hypothetical protein
LAEYAAAFLKEAVFQPGTVDEVLQSLVLPVVASFRPQVRVPELHFPIDSSGRVDDYLLYEEALKLNGLSLPRVLSFPSYFYVVDSHEVANGRYAVVVVKAVIDTAGNLVEAVPAVSTAGGFTDQLVSACRYAEYAPARMDGEPMTTEGFLVISLFPSLVYPTSPVDFVSDEDLSWHRARSVEWRLDTLGLLAAPIPIQRRPHSFHLPGPHENRHDTVNVVLKVDTLGRATPRHQSKAVPAVTRAVLAVARQMTFYPALDYGAKVREFSGVVRMEFTGSANIRIAYFWLE